ncbi:hypothetical protein AGIG_G13595 [Arapaima gigas]
MCPALVGSPGIGHEPEVAGSGVERGGARSVSRAAAARLRFSGRTGPVPTPGRNSRRASVNARAPGAVLRAGARKTGRNRHRASGTWSEKRSDGGPKMVSVTLKAGRMVYTLSQEQIQTKKQYTLKLHAEKGEGCWSYSSSEKAPVARRF